MCRGAKRLGIGSERYIEGFYWPDRDDEACPHPALLAFQMKTGVALRGPKQIG